MTPTVQQAMTELTTAAAREMELAHRATTTEEEMAAAVARTAAARIAYRVASLFALADEPAAF